MEDHITPERIANAIMQDTSFNGYYLIVEGVKDRRLFEKFTLSSNVRTRVAFGREKVKRVLELLTIRGYAKKLGIIDSDFSKIFGMPDQLEDLFVTDDHDIEVMIIKSDALRVILNNLSTSEKVHDFEQKKGIQIRSLVFELGKKIAYLKLANKMYSLGLVFKPEKSDGNQLKYKDFIAENDLTFVSVEKMVETVMNYSRNRSKSIAKKNEIISKFNELSQNQYPVEQLVNGHDLANVLFILVKKTLKSSNKMVVDYDSIESCLVLAYEYIDFQSTSLYKDISNWANGNGTQIFR